MKLADKREIKAGREEVFAALNDPDVLRKAIPGCLSLEKKSEGEFEAEVEVKVGPVKAKFKGEVTLSDVKPPESYTISGSGSGGAAGVASGSAKVSLAEEGAVTTLSYDVEVKAGGKIAQLGNRVMLSVAKSQADKFFSAFARIVEGEEEEEKEAAPEKAARGRKIKPWIWVALAIAVVVAYAYLRN